MLGSLGLPHSAKILMQEAGVQHPRSIDQDISAILTHSTDNHHQHQLLHDYFSVYIKRLIRENQM